jgi:hypothetical protein
VFTCQLQSVYFTSLHAGCLVQRTGWTRDVDIFLQWLSAIPFAGGGFNDAAIAEGLAEALMVCTGLSNFFCPSIFSVAFSHYMVVPFYICLLFYRILIVNFLGAMDLKSYTLQGCSESIARDGTWFDGKMWQRPWFRFLWSLKTISTYYSLYCLP